MNGLRIELKDRWPEWVGIYEDYTNPKRDALLKKIALEIPTARGKKRAGITLDALKRYCRRWRFILQQERLEKLTAAFSAVVFPEPLSPIINANKIIATDNCIIVGDMEVGAHMPAYLKLVQGVAMAENIDTLIFAGDNLAADALSDFPRQYQAHEQIFRREIDAFNEILRVFGRWFARILVMPGNHDMRINKATRGMIDLGDLIQAANVLYTPYPAALIETSRGLVQIAHPRNFRQDPILLAQQLYNNDPVKKHWIIAHCHRRQSGMSPDGAYECHAIGCLTDAMRRPYKMTHIKNYKAWDNSLLLIKNGYHYNLGTHTTDWRRWLGDSLYEDYLRYIQERTQIVAQISPICQSSSNQTLI